MPVPEAQWWYLIPTPFAFGKRVGVLLQDLEAVPPIMVVKMFSQAVPGPQGPQASGKGEWSLRRSLWETDVKDLQNVLHLTDWQPVPVNSRPCTIHTTHVQHHQTRCNFHSTVWEGDLPSKSPAVHRPPYLALSSHCLLQLSGLECARLACYGF